MASTRSLRIVHVEDDELDAELVRACVEREGLEASWIRVDRLEELEKAMGEPDLDLVISDYTMPIFDGLHALDLVRERMPDIPFIFVSGTIGEERAIEALRRGATDYILKDRLARLGPAIRRALKDSAQRMQRRLVEAELRRTYEQLRRLLEASPTMIYSARPEGPITCVSDNIRVRLGYEPQAVAATPGFWADRIHPEDRAAALAVRDKLDIRGVCRYRVLHADGSVRWIEDSMTVVRDALGRPVDVLGSWTDITYQKGVEDERTRLEEQFHQAQKMEAVGSLAGGVAHDFNNILMVILGYCEVLLMRLPQDGRHRHEVLEMQKAANRGAGLAHQLLAFSRKQTASPEAIEPAEAVRSLGKMIGRLIGENNQLELVLDDAPGPILCDPTHLDQILVNLVVNARDAMPDGGTVTIGCRAAGDDGVELWVSDTGVGIPPEHRDRIFEPFFTTKAAGKGTGLGLAMVLGAVKQNQATIDVQSEVGRGTTVRIVFPLHRSTPAPAAVTQTALAADGRGLSILLAEDDEAVRRVTTLMLESLGYSVTAAESGERALEMVNRAQVVDVVVTDVVMKGMSGPALVRELRRTRPGLPAVFCTGYLDDQERVPRELGAADAVVHKPFDREAMERAVQSVVRRQPHP